MAQLSSPWVSFPSPGKWVADSADPPLVWGGEEVGNLQASCCALLLTLTLNYTTAASGKKKKQKTCYGPSSFLAYLLAQFPSNLLSFVLSFPSFLPPSPPYFPSFSPQLTHLPLLLILLSLLLLPHLLPLFFFYCSGFCHTLK